MQGVFYCSNIFKDTPSNFYTCFAHGDYTFSILYLSFDTFLHIISLKNKLANLCLNSLSRCLFEKNIAIHSIKCFEHKAHQALLVDGPGGLRTLSGRRCKAYLNLYYWITIFSRNQIFSWKTGRIMEFYHFNLFLPKKISKKIQVCFS